MQKPKILFAFSWRETLGVICISAHLEGNNSKKHNSNAINVVSTGKICYNGISQTHCGLCELTME